MGNLTFADVSEGVRATIAAYAHALDDGRTEDLVATFCSDGVVDMPGYGTHSGHDAIRTWFAKLQPVVPQRHIVANTHVSEWSDTEATAVSDLLFLTKGEKTWSVQMVGRYHDTLHCDDGTWRFHHRKAEFVT